MHDDHALLLAYVEHGSEAAFASLVQRHIGLVYATALRRLAGDAHLADDVTQAVFTALARKAPSLRHHTTLSGWLYLSTQLATAATVRREQRRKLRETTAHAMHLADATPAPTTDANLAVLRPVLDDAIVALKSDDRTAIVLRFFEQRSFAEIGAALRVTEEAARKRVDRALEKLQTALSRRGVTSTAAALGLALAASGTGAVPTGLATQVSSAALAHTATTAVSVFSTLAAVVVPVAAALVLGAAVIGSLRRDNVSAAADLARLTRENQSLATLRFETQRLAADLAIANDLRHALTELPALRTRLASLPRSAAPATVANITTVTPDGRLMWNGSPVTLDEFLAHLRSAQQSSSGQDNVFLIRANGGNFHQMTYPLVEAAKAGIQRIIVESDDDFLRPPPFSSWF